MTRSSRGFTSMMVLTLIMLVTATVTATTLLFATQARRTQTTSAGAQLRQLLSAAIPVARQEITGSIAQRTVTIPTPIDEATLTLAISGDESAVTVIAKARWKTFDALETLIFARGTDGKWVLQAATLNRSP